MAAMPMLAGVGLLMVCCSSSSIASMLMGGGEETPDAGAGADDSGAGAGETCDETLSGEKDAGYRGCQAQTVTGKTCQSWGLQTPHGHKQVLGERGVEAGHNYCRNPDGEDTIWCYTTDPEKRWEYCKPL
jgi:hypothetical protein